MTVVNDKTQGDAQELEDLRRSILQQIGIYGDSSVQHGFGDTDLYVRFGNYWEYACKFRSIQVGGRLGLLIPTGKRQNIHYPSSIPFGGNGHWGMYGAVDTLFELKEDWKVGLYVRVNTALCKNSMSPRSYGVRNGQLCCFTNRC